MNENSTELPQDENQLIAERRAKLKALRERGIASIVASPLSRAHDTAKVAATLLDLPVHLDEGLRETSFGAQEGKPMTDWFADWVNGTYTPPDAEAFATLLWDGVYNYSYVARATTPGEFVVPPAKAEEMYSPEVFGRSASDRVVVE